MNEPTTPAPIKWYESPLVKRAIDIAIAVAVAWLASKGLKLPGETPPPVTVSVSYPPPAADHK